MTWLTTDVFYHRLERLMSIYVNAAQIPLRLKLYLNSGIKDRVMRYHVIQSVLRMKLSWLSPGTDSELEGDQTGNCSASGSDGNNSHPDGAGDSPRAVCATWWACGPTHSGAGFSGLLTTRSPQQLLLLQPVLHLSSTGFHRCFHYIYITAAWWLQPVVLLSPGEKRGILPGCVYLRVTCY